MLDWKVYLGIGAAGLIDILIMVKLRRFCGRVQRSLSPQPQPLPLHELLPRPPPNEDGQIPNSGFSAVSEAPPDYNTLFPDMQ